MRTPGPDHPIELRAAERPMRALCGGREIASSAQALVMREANHPPVVYFPRDSVDMSALEPSPTTSWCPYKGEASYVSLEGGVRDIGWSYETPLLAMQDIAGRIAFYAGKVIVEEA
ncbi:MAG: DUF427 domain-containing protein [Beijerinckiaceae bacterium]|nr:DUF427 domain-containing protein [Beijerinckiaceae bacterium]